MTEHPAPANLTRQPIPGLSGWLEFPIRHPPPLPREQVKAEWAAAGLTAVPAELGVLKAEVDSVVTRQSTLATELNAAPSDLEPIVGQDAAAQSRVGARSRMANVAERYIYGLYRR